MGFGRKNKEDFEATTSRFDYKKIAMGSSFLSVIAALICLIEIVMMGGGSSGDSFATMLLQIAFVVLIITIVASAAFWFKYAQQLINTTETHEIREQNNQEAILRLLDELTEFSNGDLTVQAEVTEEFTGAIADSVNYAIESMRELVGTINRTSKRVSEAAIGTRKIASQMQESATAQAGKIHDIGKIITNMVSSLNRVESSSMDSAELARNSVMAAEEGMRRVGDTIRGMDIIRENIQETSKRIKRLGESSQEIGNIVEMIKGIAEQTNILALNAAIQANQAGEEGRGFAVVADEVQKLAERSGNEVKRIETLVRTIQSDTNEAIASMEKSTKEVVAGSSIAEEAGKSLVKIQHESDSLAGMIEIVSNSTRTVSAMAGDVATEMERINQMTATTSESVIKTSDSIANLSQLSQELERSVAGFKLPKGYE